MYRNVSATLFSVLLVLIFAHSGLTLSSKGSVHLKKAGVSDQTIQLIVKEKVIETAAFTVDDIVNMKKAGLGDKTLQMLIKENSFLKNSEPIVYGDNTRSLRFTSPQDVIELKKRGVSDDVIQAVIEATKSGDKQDRERAWDMLQNMDTRIYVPGDL